MCLYCQLPPTPLHQVRTPYPPTRHHKKALRAVAFHPRYPLFASGSDDGSVIVCHGMVYK